MEYYNKNLVISNQLVKGRYTLTKEEQRFIYLIISQINKNDTKFTEYQIHIKDLENAELVQKNYPRYREFARKLRRREIIIEDDNQILVSGWFSDIVYIKNTGYIKATISDKLKPYLLQLKQEFIQAKLPILLKFISKYSSRLYLLLKSDFDRQKKHKSTLYIVYDINDLRNRFEMPESYSKVYSKFKEIFLIKSIKEINEKTDLSINYKEFKTGRKITSIEFCVNTMKQKAENIDKLSKDLKDRETKSDYIPKESSKYVIETLLDDELDLSKNDIKHIFENYKLLDIEDVCYELYNSWDNSKLISRIGFLRGKLKQLNMKKQNKDKFFGFDEI